MKKITTKIICGTNLDAKQKLEGLVSSFSSLKQIEFNKNTVILPGFCDVHVHLREPGFSYKETIKTGTTACAHGGFTTVMSMPNLNPVPDSKKNLSEQLTIIEKDAVIEVLPYGSITVSQKGESLSNMDEMKDLVAGFSDDGRGVQDEELMRQAMIKAKALDKIVVAHCEVNDLLKGGYIHDGEYAKKHNHKGICSESEYREVERDIRLAKETGAKLHLCHMSTKESVELIRKAKLEGVDVTAETAPHYLILTDKNLREDGIYKMNPPLRGKEDRKALIDGIIDGTIDMIATDHAPHSQEEKSKGLKNSAFGIVGIETSFQLMYTHLVKKGIITLEKLIDLLSINPRKRFNLEINGFSVWDLKKKVKLTKDFFLSKGSATPFINKKVYGKNLLTVYKNQAVYHNK